MDLKELREILQILGEEEIAEFELEEAGVKLRIRRSGSSDFRAGARTAPAALQAGASTQPVGAGAPAAGSEPTGQSEEEDLVVVKSPIVGTFYRAPDPNSPAFVSAGDHVRLGQVLCIIEAMKLMNEIESEVVGVVVKIHHDSGQPVQFGEPLFSIRPER